MSSGYKFTERSELETAVDLWISDEYLANQNYGDINSWDVSEISDFSSLFDGGRKYNYFVNFNSDISNWDVSNGTNFEFMFRAASSFNQGIGAWDVSNGTNFAGMFAYSSSFNQDISSWDVSKGTDFKWMFDHAVIFNQDISSWDVSNSNDFRYMFRKAKTFNQDIRIWNTNNGNYNQIYMFSDAYQFNSTFGYSVNFLGQTKNGDSGPNTISGDIGNDVLNGLAHDDQIYGGDGWDRLIGGTGNDSLDGGSGDDTLIGGAGDDTYVVDSTSDTVTENSSEGTDLIQSSVTYTASNNVENLTLTGSSNIDATGNSLDNTLTGNSGNNSLIGGSGTDTAVFSQDIFNYSIFRDTATGNLSINGDGLDSLSSIETVKFNNTSYSSSDLRIGLIETNSGYKLLGSSGLVSLQDSSGILAYTDSTSADWDVTSAVKTASGFQVLFDGAGNFDTGNVIWTLNSSGLQTASSGWISDDSALDSGYENTFTYDFNNDGLVSGGSSYQMLGSYGAISIQDSNGNTFNDATSADWDIVAASTTDSGFLVLLNGTGNYDFGNVIWTANSSGAETASSGWISDYSAAAAGYENSFTYDFNGDGLISGGSLTYRMLGSNSNEVTIKDSSGNTFSDSSSADWDIVSASKTDSGFLALLNGTNSYDGGNVIWTLNSSGVETASTGWISDADAYAAGYEKNFNHDFNGDGLISGGIAYKMIGLDGIIPINDRYGGTFTSESSDDWDVIKAVRTNTGYTALVDGTNFYDGGTVVWTINSLGVHTSDTGWISDADAVSAGYETVFNTDINNNGTIGS